MDQMSRDARESDGHGFCLRIRTGILAKRAFQGSGARHSVRVNEVAVSVRTGSPTRHRLCGASLRANCLTNRAHDPCCSDVAVSLKLFQTRWVRKTESASQRCFKTQTSVGSAWHDARASMSQLDTPKWSPAACCLNWLHRNHVK